MKVSLYTLLLEDVSRDAELLKEMLSDEGFNLEMDVVDNEQDFTSNLKRHNYDIIFADYTLPGFNGQKALELAQVICPNVPFIFISGTIGEDRAVELLKQGATDYVLKDRMERLPFATRRALDAAAQLNIFREKEIELQTNRRLLQTVINNALDAIFIKDINGKYILFNNAAEKAMGKTASELLGKDDTFVHSEEEAKITMEADRRVIESEMPITFEENFTLPDGSDITFHTIKCPMFDQNGKVSGLFGISRDITERKQMEKNLIEAKEKAEESDRLKTAFLQNISHEIRTPMNAIVGFAEYINDSSLTPEIRKQYAELIAENSNQLLSVISNIVSIATIEAGQEKISESKIELSSIINFLYRQYLLKAKEKGIALSMKKECGEELYVISDELKLVHILSNLLGNALKFTEKGSIDFGYSVKGDVIEFFVQDTGVGIPCDKRDSIFRRFNQLETSRSRLSGTGLGLSISKAYVELLGGEIWYESELKKGTSFHFTIPYKKSL